LEHQKNAALEKRWEKFARTGSVEDYLRYRREREDQDANR